MQPIIPAALLVWAAAGSLWADVSYTETTKYTGGTLLDVTRRMASNPIVGRLAGGRLQAAFQDQVSSVFVKGAKMARVGQAATTIFDLDAGTVTTVNNEKRTYSVETFEDLRQRIEKMQQRTNRDGQGELEFDVRVTKTGQTRAMKDQTASETVMTLTAKNSSSHGQMVVKVDTWLVPATSVTKELAEYQKKLAEKFAYAFSGGPGLGPAMGGMNAAREEMRKLDGYPVLSDISVSGVSSPMAQMGNGGDPNAPLITLETQEDNIASGAVDDTKFAVPAGFKQEKPR